MSDVLTDYAHTPVPEHKRTGAFRILAVWLAAIICVPAMMMGVSLGSAAGPKTLLLGTLLGGTILLVLTGLTARVAIATHLPTGEIISRSFGRYGGGFAAVVIAVNSFVWFGINLGFFAEGFALLVADLWQVRVPEWALLWGAGTLMTLSAFFGYRGLTVISYVAIPVMVGMLGYAGYLAPEITHFWQIDGEMSLTAVASMAVGGFAVGIAITPDFARYNRTVSEVIVGIGANLMIFAPLLFLGMAYLAIVTDSSAVVPIFFALGLGVPMALLLLLSSWTTNDSNLYIAALSISSIIRRIRKWKITLISGFFGILFAQLGVFDHFLAVLGLLGMVFTPMVMAYALDFAINPGDYQENARIQAFKWRPLASWALGVIVAFITGDNQSGGLALLTLTHIAAVDAALATAIAMFIFHYGEKR